MYGNMTYFEELIELSETPMRPGLTIARAIIEWGHNETFSKLRGPLTAAFMKFRRLLELSHHLEVLSSGMEQDELRMRARATEKTYMEKTGGIPTPKRTQTKGAMRKVTRKETTGLHSTE